MNRIIQFLTPVFFVLSPTLFFCCSHAESINQIEAISVDFSKAIDVELSSIANSIEYAPLASPQQYYIFNNWIDLKVKEDKIFILQDADVYDNFFVFNTKGDFIQQIASSGEGLGKVINASSFIVNGTFLEILDSYQNKIVRYSWVDGKFVDEKRLSTPFNKFFKVNNGYVGYMRNQIDSPDTSMHYNLFLTDENLLVKNKYFKIPDYLKNYRVKEYNFSNESEGKFLFKNFLSNKILQVTDEGITEKYIVDFNSDWVSDETLKRLSVDNSRSSRRQLLYNRTDHVFTMTNIFHDTSSLIITCSFNEKFYWIFYDKKSKVTAIYRRRINNIDFSPLGQRKYWPLAYANKSLFFLLPSEDLTYYYNVFIDSKTAGELESLRKNQSFIDYESMVTSIPASATAVLARLHLK